MIQKNTTVPTKYSQVFSTAEDNQPAVTVKVYQGEREIATTNKMLGEFNLEGISSAPRGTPQIEVTFDIDANGILHVSAKDKATGKENKVTIKANSGLSEEEINKMVVDAEENAEHDKARVELVGSRNTAEAMIHTVKKSMEDHSDKLEGGEKEKIENALKEVEEAVKTDEKDKIDKATENLTTVAQKLAELAMADGKNEDVQGTADEDTEQQKNTESDDKKTEDVVDAEFKEVKRN